MTTDLTAWHADIDRMIAAIRQRQQHTDLLDDIAHLAAGIAHHRPLVERYTDPGDGIRSPSTDGGSRPGGTHADPVLANVEARMPTYEEGSRRTPDQLRLVDAKCGNATTWLRRTVRTADDASELQARRLREARTQLTEARAILHGLLPPPGPVTFRLRRTGDPGCLSCIRIKLPDGRPFHVPTRQGRKLCWWCEKRTNAARNEWLTAHPGQQAPSDRRFWPPLKAIEWRRDEGNRPPPAAEWDKWVAEERKARKRAQASSRRKAS